MQKTKHPKKLRKEPIINLDFTFQPDKNIKIFIYIGIIIFSGLMGIMNILYALKINGYFGFPLDDPWIHLTFAKNFSKYFSFSYYKNEIVTAGSTSPIYTFLLSLAFFLTQNEFILSYFFGVLFLILSALFFYKLSLLDFGKEIIYAILVTAILISDKWLNFIAGSGMETTMFIFILISAAYFYKKRLAVPFAIFLGLILWTRPDGIALIAAIFIDYLVQIWLKKENKDIILFDKKSLIKIVIISGGIVGLYFIMNLILSGTIFPNTYNAKLTYYTPEFRSRSEFIKFEVWEYFTTGAYAIIMAGFILNLALVLFDTFKKKYNHSFLYTIFVIIFIFIYYYKLPYAHRFGRYLMPVIPFLILSAFLSYRDAAKMIGKFLKSKYIVITLILIISLFTLIISITNYLENRKTYAEQCKYINDRQVAAALWLKNNTKENDLIATHDVGAIGYYSERKIIDVAGLITPELITKLHDANYNKYMMNYLNEKGVSYLAFLREWYRVTNVNPLFSTANSLPPEVMEVFKYESGKTYILSTLVKSGLMQAENYMSRKQFREALSILQQVLPLDYNSSLTYFYLAICYRSLNDLVNAETSLEKALKIFPDYKDALVFMGSIQKDLKKYKEAKNNLEHYLSLNPNDEIAIKYLEAVNDSLNANK